MAVVSLSLSSIKGTLFFIKKAAAIFFKSVAD